MEIGLNSDPSAPLPSAGFAIRAPAWLWTPTNFAQVKAAGFQRHIVLDRRSFAEWQWPDGPFDGALQDLAGKFKGAEILESINEPDGTGDSSSPVDKQVYWQSTKALRAAFPDATVVGGGLVAVNFDYLDGLADAGATAYGLHPYAKNPDADLDALIAACAAHTTLPCWVTEFGGELALFGNEHERAVWFSGMLVRLYQNGVQAAYPYRYSDDGSAFVVAGTESEAAILDAVPNLSGSPPTPAPSTPALLKACDISNYQPDILPLLDQYQPDILIVRYPVPGENIAIMGPIADRQTAAGLGTGCKVAVYCPLYNSDHVTDDINHVLARAQQNNLSPLFGMLDIEKSNGAYPTTAQIDEAIGTLRAAQVEPWVYSSVAEWQAMGNPQILGGVKCLVARYLTGQSQPPLTIDTAGFGGGIVAGWQWTSTPVDQSVIDPSML